jgi:hypothetical protein
MNQGGIRGIGRGIEIIVIEIMVVNTVVNMVVNAVMDQDQAGINHQEIEIDLGKEKGVMRGITIVSAKREIHQDAMVTLVIRTSPEIEIMIEVILMIDMRPCPSHRLMIERKESAFSPLRLVSTT